MSLYDSDFHAWAQEQADAVRRRSWNEVDWENLAEELEDLGSQQRAELGNRFGVLLMHLLKWLVQPGHRSNSWRSTIRVQRKDLRKHLAKNPSLKSDLPEIFSDAYDSARLKASAETGFADDQFPERSPFTPEEALDDIFWPADSGADD